MRGRVLALSLLLAALCALGFVLRTTNAATVFVGDAIVFPENDPYYHMRRIFQILAAYPRVPSFDPWIDHPHGAPVVFAPLFDLGIASLAKLSGLGAADQRAVETLAAFVPPLLGALICVPVLWLALQATSAGAAMLAATLAILVPAHIWYSRLGFVDHHVAVTLVYVMLCALVLRALGVGRDPGEASRGAARALATLLATLALAAGVLLWNGFLLLVLVLDVGLIALFLAADAARRREVARLALVLHAGAAALVLPAIGAIVRGTGAPFSTVTLSYLHVATLGALALLAAIAGWASARGWSARRVAALLAAVAVLGAAVLVLEGSVAARVAQWLFAADPFMGAVQESLSIVLTSDGRLDLAEPQIWMSRFFLVVPVLLALLAYRVARGRFADRGRLFVLVWATLLFLLTLRQRRFGEVFAPALAVLVADFLVGGARSARELLAARGLDPRAAGTLAALGVALLIVVAFAPYYGGFVTTPGRLGALLRAPLRAGAAPADSAPDRAQQDASSDVRLQGALRRFGALKRDAERAAAEQPQEASGVMNPWPLGHKLLYVAQTPVTATPFGSYVGGTSFEDWIDFFLTANEAHGLEILARRGSRWVVVDNDLGTIGAAIVGRGENPRDYYGKVPGPDGITYTYQPLLLRSLYLRLTKLVGSELELPAPDGSEQTVPALDHLRLVLDSASDDQIGFPKAYEVVRGAVLLARGVPGATVAARYAYRSNAGRDRVYSKTMALDARGEARMVLPYSSERPDLGQTSAWSIESGGHQLELRVAEDEVREGREVSVTVR